LNFWGGIFFGGTLLGSFAGLSQASFSNERSHAKETEMVAWSEGQRQMPRFKSSTKEHYSAERLNHIICWVQQIALNVFDTRKCVVAISKQEQKQDIWAKARRTEYT